MSTVASPRAQDSTDLFVEVFAALSEPIRVEMIKLMLQRFPDDLPCTTLDDELPIAKSTISYHVKTLRQAGLIDVRKAGRNYFYELRVDKLELYAPALLEHLREQLPLAS